MNRCFLIFPSSQLKSSGIADIAFAFIHTGLALSSLLTAPNDSIYKRFEPLLQSICEALNDIMKEDNDDPVVMVEYVPTDITSKQTVFNIIFVFFNSSLILTTDTTLESNGLWKIDGSEYNSHQYERCRSMCLTDPVHTIVLKSYVESQVSLSFF